MKISVIGAGSWGTTVASLTAHASDVMLWARRPELADVINQSGQNPDYLPGFDLAPGLTATADLGEALAGADVLVIGVPSHGVRAVLDAAAPEIDDSLPIVSLTKGLETGTNMRMTEVIADVLPNHNPAGIGVLTGPNLAREIVAGQPAASVISVPDEEIAVSLQALFMAPTLRVYSNTDVVGCEMAGSLKNVMALEQDPVFLYPGSRVISPVEALRDLISTASSSSVPFTMGNSYFFPSNSSMAISDIFRFCLIYRQR